MSCTRMHTPDARTVAAAFVAAPITEGVGTDVRCKKKTNLIGIQYSMEPAHQRQLIEKPASKPDAITEAKQAQLKAARTITAGA